MRFAAGNVPEIPDIRCVVVGDERAIAVRVGSVDPIVGTAM